MKVYIASPFFNEEQLERVQFIENKLTENNIEFFSPRSDTYVRPDSSSEERKKAFEDNIKAIAQSDFIIAVTDGKDVGTMFEAGYAYAKLVPIVYFAETLGDKPFNLMLAMSAIYGVVRSREQFGEFLNFLNGADILDAEYTGEIE